MNKIQIDHFFQLMEQTTPQKRDNIRSLYLERIGEEIIEFCKKYYSQSTKTDFRNDVLRYVIRYAQINKEVINLALLALNDKSKK
jgi:septum formation topological specificity factor MinE